VFCVRRPDKGVVADGEFDPAVFEIVDQQIGMFLRGPAFLSGGFFDLLAVLVGAGEKENIVASKAIIACKNVGCYCRIGMPDVRNISLT